MLYKNSMLLLCIFCSFFLAAQQSNSIHAAISSTDDEMMLEQETIYTIKVWNDGSKPYTNLKLCVQTNEKMEIVSAKGSGFNIQKGVAYFEISTLEPGKDQIFSVTCIAQKVGYAIIVARLTCDQANQEIMAEGSGKIYKPFKTGGLVGYSYDTEDPVEVGKETTYVVVNRNKGSTACTNVVFTFIIPSQMKFLSAEGPTSYKLESEYVCFNPLEAVKPGEKIVYKVHYKAKTPGSALHVVKVRYNEFDKEVQDTEGTSVYIPEPSNTSDIFYDTEDPVQVGKETTYVGNITNRTAAPYTNLVFTGVIPSQMEFISAEGPTPYKFESGCVYFEPLAELKPGEKLTIKIHCKAITPGSANCALKFKYNEFSKEIITEEGTSVYK